jgi:hypothetical protein
LRNHHHHNPQPSADGKQPLGLCVDEGHKSNPDYAFKSLRLDLLRMPFAMTAKLFNSRSL